MHKSKFVFLLVLTARFLSGQDDSGATPAQPVSDEAFQWKPALLQAFLATTIAHTVRVTTEDDTQSELGGPFWSNYFHSVENIHGWDDGDAFYTTWMLHPMEGSLAGFIEQQNDPKYRTAQFGASQRYWVGRLRALAFSAAYSTQWTMGPYSEASIGNVQHYDSPGVDDLVVTPILGMAWMVGEDAMDRYVIRWIEGRYRNPYLRLVARSALNPTRSFANIVRFQVPWQRFDRGGVFGPNAVKTGAPDPIPAEPRFDSSVWPRSASFELATDAVFEKFLGVRGSSCLGGQGRGALRLSPSWQAVVNVGGCKLLGMPANSSGDTLWYMAGSRYSRGFALPGLQSYVEALAGGMKIAHDHVDPALRAELTALAAKDDRPKPPSVDYTTEADTNALSVEMGMGLTYHLNHAAVIRLCSVDYQHSWNRSLEGLEYNNGLRVSAGMSFRLGRWSTE
jgi:hypothetical protein